MQDRKAALTLDLILRFETRLQASEHNTRDRVQTIQELKQVIHDTDQKELEDSNARGGEAQAVTNAELEAECAKAEEDRKREAEDSQWVRSQLYESNQRIQLIQEVQELKDKPAKRTSTARRPKTRFIDAQLRDPRLQALEVRVGVYFPALACEPLTIMHRVDTLCCSQL